MPLPIFTDARGRCRVAAQSELHALYETHFLLLCRDSGNGYGVEGVTSAYRRIEVLDVSQATDIAGSQYDGVVPVAPNGKLVDGMKPTALTSSVDMNDNVQLNKFGLHNGAPNDPQQSLGKMGRHGAAAGACSNVDWRPFTSG